MNITKEHFKCYRPIKLRLIGKSCYYRKGLKEEWDRYIPYGNLLPGFSLKVITQEFGKDFRYNGQWFYKDQLGMNGHNGIDWRAFRETCLYSPIDGKIVDVYNVNDGYGKYIKIESNEFKVDNDDYKFIVIEGHLHDIVCKIGDIVEHGQLIGTCNNTGYYTTGDHLHEGFRLYKKVNGKWKYDDNNGYHGYIDHKPLIVNPNIKMFSCLQNDKPYLQIIDEVGGFYKKNDIDLEVLSSEKDPITRHIPLVDEVIRILNKQGLNEGITTKEFNQIIQE